MMGAISWLTFAYLCALSIFLLRFGHDGLLGWLGSVLFLAWPALVAWALARCIPRGEMRGPMFVFDALFCLLTIVVIQKTFFSGEQDAQYQLLMLAIPAGGLIGLVVAGAFGAVRVIVSKRC